MVSILEQPADCLENRTCTHMLTNGRAPIRGTSQVLMEDFHAQASMRGGTNKSHCRDLPPRSLHVTVGHVDLTPGLGQYHSFASFNFQAT